jgi:N-acetyl-alpha-D-muramate 1-phosphate uridylyltransferase
MQIVILAGGLATRLKPLSNFLPKSLIEIHDHPFIYHQLNGLIKLGFSKFVFCLGNLSEPLENYLNTLVKWNKYFTYSFEKEPFGTGGAIVNAYSLLEETFIVINGDNIILGDYQSAINYYISSNIESLVFIRKAKGNGNVIFNNSSKRIEKYNRDCSVCQYEDIGLKIFKKTIFKKYINEIPISLEDNIYHDLINDNKLHGILVNNHVLDIGSFESIKKTKDYFSQ